MDKETRLKQVADHVARHLESCYRGYNLPCRETLTDYIYSAIRDYEHCHKNQKIEVIEH